MSVEIKTGIKEIKVLPSRDYGNKDEIWVELIHGVTIGISTHNGIISHLSIAGKETKRD